MKFSRIPTDICVRSAAERTQNYRCRKPTTKAFATLVPPFLRRIPNDHATQKSAGCATKNRLPAAPVFWPPRPAPERYNQLTVCLSRCRAIKSYCFKECPMKKTILSSLMVAGLTVSFFVGISVSQEQGVTTEKQIALEELNAARKQRAAIITQQRVRAELLQLFQQHLQSLNEEELTSKKAKLQKEIREFRAESKLREAKKLRQQAKEILQDIVKTYPKSQAAEQARKMLETPALPTKANPLGTQLK